MAQAVVVVGEHADLAGAEDVAGGVVDEEASFDGAAEAVGREAEDAGVGLGESDVAGGDDVVEQGGDAERLEAGAGAAARIREEAQADDGAQAAEDRLDFGQDGGVGATDRLPLVQRAGGVGGVEQELEGAQDAIAVALGVEAAGARGLVLGDLVECSPEASCGQPDPSGEVVEVGRILPADDAAVVEEDGVDEGTRGGRGEGSSRSEGRGRGGGAGNTPGFWPLWRPVLCSRLDQRSPIAQLVERQTVNL